MEIILTEEEKAKIEVKAKQLAKEVTDKSYMYVMYESVQSIIDQADRLIEDLPHLTYSDIGIDAEDNYDNSKSYYFEYKTDGDWKPLYDKMCKDALSNKQARYNRYLESKKEFEGDL